MCLGTLREVPTLSLCVAGGDVHRPVWVKWDIEHRGESALARPVNSAREMSKIVLVRCQGNVLYSSYRGSGSSEYKENRAE